MVNLVTGFGTTVVIMIVLILISISRRMEIIPEKLDHFVNVNNVHSMLANIMGDNIREVFINMRTMLPYRARSEDRDPAEHDVHQRLGETRQ